MKIIWNKNPLRTVIELNDTDKEIFKLKIKCDELIERAGSAYFALDWVGREPKKRTSQESIEEAKRLIHTGWLYNSKEYGDQTLDARVEEMYEYYLKALSYTHEGDCVCIACSCEKCKAEEMLGINTIEGLGKHPANKIANAFGHVNERTIDEAIDYLANYKVEPQVDPGWDKLGGYEQFVPRWTREAKSAHDWLVNYRDKHFLGSEFL